ncbi:MAG: MarR family winged helix-turn-helix transcriptional regulator [Gammaproteobacteria bacterium]
MKQHEDSCIAEIRELHILLVRLGGRLLEMGDRLLTDTPLTVSRSRMLGALHNMGPPPSISDLARRLTQSRQAVMVLARKMELDGLVRCVPDPAGGRTVRISLTRKGSAVYFKSNEFQLRYFQTLVGVLDAGEMRATLDVLRRLDTHVDTYTRGLAQPRQRSVRRRGR